MEFRSVPASGFVVRNIMPGAEANSHIQADALTESSSRVWDCFCCEFRYRQCCVSEGDTNGAVPSQRGSFLPEPNSQRIQPTASLPASTRQQLRASKGMSISMSRPPGIESNLRLTTILPPKTFQYSRPVERFAKSPIGCRADSSRRLHPSPAWSIENAGRSLRIEGLE